MNERLPTRLFATDRYSGRRLNCYPSIEEPEVEKLNDGLPKINPTEEKISMN